MAANKMITSRWQAQQSLQRQQRLLAFLDILDVKESIAKLHGAKPKTLNVFVDAAESVKALLLCIIYLLVL